MNGDYIAATHVTSRAAVTAYLSPMLVGLVACSILRLAQVRTGTRRPTTLRETPQQILDRRAAAGQFDADIPARVA